MTNLTLIAIAALTLSFAISFTLTPFVIKLMTRLGIVDDPKTHKHEKVIHDYPVPRGGGLAIMISFFISSIIFLPLDKHLWGILLGAIIVIIVGLIDDKYDISPYVRVFTSILAAALPIAAGIGIAFISSPLGGTIDLSQPQVVFDLLGQTRSIWLISDLFALVWIVFLMNALNTSANGVDGQLVGVTVAAGIVISLISLKFSAEITQWPVLLLALITTGAYAGFWPFSFFPQKIMPSYGGATLAGYLLAILSILSTAKVGTLAVVLAIPLLDAVYAIVRRILSGKSPLKGDRGHIHHLLLDAGFSKKSIALIYFATSLILGLLALNLHTWGKIYTFIFVVVSLGIFVTWLKQSHFRYKS